MSNPQVYYFPLRASVDNVHVYHPSEGRTKGFKADRVFVQLELSALLRKRFVLNLLKIDGSWIHSEGKTTAFLRVLEFVLKKPKPQKALPQTNSWKDLFTSGWRAWVQEVVIATRTGESERQVLVGTEDVRVEALAAEFSSNDPHPVPGKPVHLAIAGSGMQLAVVSSPPVPLHLFSASAQVNNGIMEISDARVWSEESADTRASKSSAQGRLFFGDEERYEIAVEGLLYDRYVADLVYPLADTLAAGKPRLEYTMQVSGPLDRPLMKGDLAIRFEEPSPVFMRQGCEFRHATLAYEVSVDGIAVENLHLEDIVADGSLSLRFNEMLPLTASAGIKLDSNSPYLARCIPATRSVRGGSDELTPFSHAVREALANSSTQVEINGTLADRKVQARIDSEIYRKSHHAHSKLGATLRLEESQLSLSLQEKGLVPRIGRPLRKASGLEQTRFTLVQGSAVDLSASYDIESGQLQIAKGVMTRYPGDKFAARLAPFLSSRQYQEISKILTKQSFISADVQGAFSTQSGQTQAEGSVTVSDVLLGPIKAQSIRFPFRAQGAAVESAAFELRTEGGMLNGSGSLGSDGALNAEVEIEQMDHRSFSYGKQLLEQLQTVISGTASVSGTTKKPILNATLEGTSIYQGAKVKSSLLADGDSAGVSLRGSLLGKRARINAHWPFVADAALRLQAELDAFPLPDAAASETLEPLALGTVQESMEEVDVEAQGSVTASLDYTADAALPWAGSGKLSIEHLHWPTAQLQVPQSDPILARIKDSALHFDAVRLRVKDKVLTVTGLLHKERGWDVRLQGAWELAAISQLMQPLEQVDGALEVAVRVNGALLQPQIDGEVKLNDGSLSFLLANSVVGVSSASGLVVFDGSSAVLERFDGAVGDGAIVARGTISKYLDNLSRELRLAVRIQEGRIEPAQNLSVQFDSLLTLAQSGTGRFLLSGQVEIEEARYTERVEIGEMIASLSKKIIGSDSTRVRGAMRKDVPLDFDLEVRAANGLLVETDMGTGELRGLLKVSGAAADIALDGKVEVLSGNFRLGLNTFDILSGELFFSSKGGVRFDPKLAIVAETIVESGNREEHVVRMSISGTLANPEVHFTSDSGLTENEIVALFGLGGRGLEIFENRNQRTFTELLDPRSDLTIRERLVGLTGFRDVHIESGLSEDTGEFVPRVRARRPLIGKSELEVASELSGEQVSEAEVQYPLTPNLDATIGWRSRPVTEDVNASSGSYSFGVRFQEQFLGTSLFPIFSEEAEAGK